MLYFLLLNSWFSTTKHRNLADFDELQVLSLLEGVGLFFFLLLLACLSLFSDLLLEVLVSALLFGIGPFLVDDIQVLQDLHALVSSVFDFL